MLKSGMMFVSSYVSSSFDLVPVLNSFLDEFRPRDDDLFLLRSLWGEATKQRILPFSIILRDLSTPKNDGWVEAIPPRDMESEELASLS